MMSREAKLCSVIILLVLISGSVYLWKRQAHQTNVEQRNTPLFASLTKEKIAGLDLELGSSYIQLRKRQDTWYVQDQDYPANPLFVSMLIRGILEMPPGTLVTTDVAKHDQFELGGRAWLVRVMDAQQQEITRIYIGKSDPSYRGCYIRLQADPNIYYVPIAFGVFLRRPTWYDRTVWQVPTSAVQTIRFAGPTPFELTHQDKSFINKQTGEMWEEQDPALQPFLHLVAGNVRFDGEKRPEQAKLEIQIEGQWLTLFLCFEKGHWIGWRDRSKAQFVLANDLLMKLTAFADQEN